MPAPRAPRPSLCHLLQGPPRPSSCQLCTAFLTVSAILSCPLHTEPRFGKINLTACASLHKLLSGFHPLWDQSPSAALCGPATASPASPVGLLSALFPAPRAPPLQRSFLSHPLPYYFCSALEQLFKSYLKKEKEKKSDFPNEARFPVTQLQVTPAFPSFTPACPYW